jgi:hypothetical protein
MANSNKINGASPVGTLSGVSWAGPGRLYAIPSTDTTASYAVGDIVMSAGGSDATGIPYVKKIPAASASAFVPLGIVVGVRVADPTVTLQGVSLPLENTFILKSTRTVDKYVLVCDDPNILFTMSAGATATNVTLAKMRYNCNIGSYYSGADNAYAIDQNATVTTLLNPGAPYSNIILPSSGMAVTASLPIQMLGLYQSPDNAIGSYARILCKWNYHEFGLFATVPGTQVNFLGL